MNNYNRLCDVLKTNSTLITEDGKLLKNKIQELARKMDASLLSTLLSDAFTEKMFFVDVNGTKIFDANKFAYIVESQSFLPDSYTRFKQNIMLTDGFHSIRKSGDVVLEFPNKDCVLEFDSTNTDTARDEIFLNETLMKKEIDTLLEHKTFSNTTRYTVNGAEPATEVSMNDNIIIKGNNLLTLHTLYPKYKNQIKLMYWDILYNTQSDQVPYNDSFKHSSWLVMMKNRLEIAQKLLKDDGVICLQCDDNEQAYLTVLCDEIFGRENHLNTIVIEMASTGGLKRTFKDKRFLKTKEYILIYTKSGFANISPLYDEEGTLDKHYSIYFKDNEFIPLSKKIQEVFPNRKVSALDYLAYPDIKKWLIDNAEYVWRVNGHPIINWANDQSNIITVLYENDDLIIERIEDKTKNKSIIAKVDKSRKSVLTDMFNLSQKVQKINDNKTIAILRGDLWKGFHKPMGNVTKEGDVKLANGKKTEYLIADIISVFTQENDIVLDAYLGSGTTTAVAHKMGRRYIGIEQLDSHSKMTLKRMQKVINGDQTGISKAVNWTGGGSFVYFELAKNSQNIIDKIVSSNNKEELQIIYDELKMSPFVLYTVDILKMEKEKDAFVKLTIDEQKKFLISIIDKNTLYINYSDINNNTNSLTEQDKLFTKNFYKED